MWTPEAVEKSRALAVVLGQVSFMDEPDELPEWCDFTVWSKPPRRVKYGMAWTPEGLAIHIDEGCESERFNGILTCWHSAEYMKGDAMTTALATTSVLTPAPIEFNQEQMQVITDSICKGATPSELQLFVATCKRTGLDPFMRQIYAVKRYDSKERREVMAIQVGIDGLRLIAERTDRYAGQDPIEFLDSDGVWSEVWTGKDEFPLAARCAVYRKDWPDHKARATCRWDSYAQTHGADHKLMPTWEKMPDVMLGKCAEALALRRAFPAEMSGMAAMIGGDYDPESDVEMRHAEVVETRPLPVDDAIDGEVVTAPPRPAPAPPTPTPGGVSAPAFDGPAPVTQTKIETPTAKGWPEHYTDQLDVLSAVATDLAQSWPADDLKALAKEGIERWPSLASKSGTFSTRGCDASVTYQVWCWLRERRGDPVEVEEPQQAPLGSAT